MVTPIIVIMPIIELNEHSNSEINEIRVEKPEPERAFNNLFLPFEGTTVTGNNVRALINNIIRANSENEARNSEDKIFVKLIFNEKEIKMEDIASQGNEIGTKTTYIVKCNINDDTGRVYEVFITENKD